MSRWAEPGRWQAFAGAVCLLVALQAMASARLEGSESAPEERRPRIGLALSGGGARGCAHIGVLKVLEELRVPVDFIAGTSMGAVVGGLYATGKTAAEIETFLMTLDWEAMAEDEPPRRDRSYRRKEDDQRYVMNLEIGLDGFVFPRGLRSGRTFTFELRRQTLPVLGITEFSELPVPFTAVAVDLETGERVLIERGSLAGAMRASMSIPGVFTPVEGPGGRLLVDGGIVANLPIDVVREMGADVVIAVDIGERLHDRSELGSLFSVASQALSISGARGVQDLLPTADLVLRPEVDGRGALDFTDLAAVIAAGEEAAHRHAEQLTELAMPPAPYACHLEGKKLTPAPPRPVSAITIRGLERVDERVVRRLLRTRPGEPLRFEVLRRDLGRIFGLGDFESVDFELHPAGEGLVVEVRVREKAGGPFFLRSALNLDLDEDQDATTSILVNLTALRLNTLGLEWRTDARIGSEQLLATELYQPLDFSGRFFVALGASRRRDLPTAFAGDRPLAEVEQVRVIGALDIGLVLGTYGELRLGAYRERQDQELVTGPEVPGLPASIDLGGWRGSLAIDRLDSIYFPRRGQLGSLVVELSRPALGAQDRYDRAALNHVGVASRGRHTWLAWLEVGTSLGDDPPPYASFGGGGLFSFSGYRRGELVGASYGVVRPTYIYRLASLPPILGKGVYLGAWLEAGNFWPTREDASLDDLRYAATLALGAETLVGPAYLALGVAEDNRIQLTLSIGPSLSARPR